MTGLRVLPHLTAAGSDSPADGVDVTDWVRLPPALPGAGSHGDSNTPAPAAPVEEAPGAAGVTPDVPAGRVTGRDPARPRTRLAVAAQLAQTAVLALALGVLVAPAPGPERTATVRPATAEESQQWEVEHLRWVMQHP